MGILGPNQNEIWRKISDDIGATFIEGSFCKTCKVQARFGPWTVFLDNVSDGESSTYTRMRAPFVTLGDFRFSMTRTNLFTPLGKMFGMQPIEIGDPEFDASFVVRSNDEGRVRELLASPRIRELLNAQPKVRFTIKDNEGCWFKKRFPSNVDALYFTTGGVAKDELRLKGLFDLFAETLHRLQILGVATKDISGVTL